MTSPSKCSCIFCRKELTNLGLPGHYNIKHAGNKAFQLAGNKSRRGKPAWNTGLTKLTDVRVADLSLKLKDIQAKKSPEERSFKMSEEGKQKISAAKKKLYASGWEPVCGRAKKYVYVSSVAGEIKVDGAWEFIVARYLDFLGVQWVRNKKRFDYIRPDGKEATYQPDFFVSDWNAFIEVKGYKTELDTAKWNQFPEQLIIWQKDKIKSIESELKRI